MAKYKWPTFNQECSAGYVLTLPEFGRLVCLVSSHLSCSSLWDGLWDESEMIWQVVKWWLGLSNSRYKVKGKMIHFAWININFDKNINFIRSKMMPLENLSCQIILQISFFVWIPLTVNKRNQQRRSKIKKLLSKVFCENFFNLLLL